MLEIKKPKDKDLIVLNLSDFNMSDEEMIEGCMKRKMLEGTVKELVETVKPDYITITGDITYGHCLQNYDTLGKMIDSYGIPWSFCWGNHDDEAENREGGMDRLADILTKNENCMFEKGDPAYGNGNYVVKVTEDGNPIYAFIFMDSHNREYIPDKFDEKGRPCFYWGRFYQNQIAWYEKTAKEIGVKNTLLAHIPIPTYQDAIEAAWNKEYDPKSVELADSYDPKYWNDGYKDSYGLYYEGICSYPTDNGEFDAIKRAGTTELMIVGHDHVNCFSVKYQGVTLAYAMKTGAGCYSNKKMNGGTVLRINKDGARMEHIFIDREKFI